MRIENLKISITEDQLQLQKISDDLFRLTAGFDVSLTLFNDDEITYNIFFHVNAGMKTDLISAPEKVLSYYGVSRDMCKLASIIHDRLYANPIVSVSNDGRFTLALTQKECDYIMKVILIDQGCSKDSAHFIYKILRNWGWVGWFKHIWRRFIRSFH